MSADHATDPTSHLDAVQTFEKPYPAVMMRGGAAVATANDAATVEQARAIRMFQPAQPVTEADAAVVPQLVSRVLPIRVRDIPLGRELNMSAFAPVSDFAAEIRAGLTRPGLTRPDRDPLTGRHTGRSRKSPQVRAFFVGGSAG